jgi:hypothetical protein
MAGFAASAAIPPSTSKSVLNAWILAIGQGSALCSDACGVRGETLLHTVVTRCQPRGYGSHQRRLGQFPCSRNGTRGRRRQATPIRLFRCPQKGFRAVVKCLGQTDLPFSAPQGRSAHRTSSTPTLSEFSRHCSCLCHGKPIHGHGVTLLLHQPECPGRF